MNEDQWQRVEELFEAAVDRTPNERSAYLTEACGDNVELRAEVESLLDHDSQVEQDFLNQPEPLQGLSLLSPSSSVDPLINQHVGDFKIQRVIASGGMGTVYEALQEQPRRSVALKILRNNVASHSVLRRFQFESQILAYLRHPNIAQVYQAGLYTDRQGLLGPTGGRVPYFAMEFIPDARTITRHAEEHQLGISDRLRLFTKVCDAIHHGHQKGIIHRDLKPGNILIDSAGEPKVIDFGVARSTDSDIAITTIQTDVGQFIGTLRYMSPEQCAANPHEIDTRSDVYSLGVVLHELLTGELPYETDGSSIVQAARIICEREPLRPGTINRKLRGDVEKILLKALEKERTQRYQSAAELSRDIHRYLNHELIEARPTTLWIRSVRGLARHPAITSTALSLAIAGFIIGGALLNVWFFNRQPYRIDPSDDHREVSLLSRIGGVLHVWSDDGDGLISSARLVDQPAGSDRGKLALLTYGHACNTSYRTALCAYDTSSDFENPIWTQYIRNKDIPLELRARGMIGQEYGAYIHKVADVFPEIPDQEIITYHLHCKNATCAIRIYDLQGTLHYQIWHDGNLPECYWMSDARLLVLAGHNCQGRWDLEDASAESRHPAIVFAVRPQRGTINKTILEPDPVGEPLFEWYHTLHPLQAATFTRGIMLAPPAGGYEPGRTVNINFDTRDNQGANVGWLINELGDEIPSTRVVNDKYRLNQRLHKGDDEKLPDPDAFNLGPLSLDDYSNE